MGNFTAGGTGKTPTAIHLGNLLAALGEKPVFLTRGHGGQEKGPYWVDSHNDDPARVGDEPLLLARHRPTLIARDRASGARAIESGNLQIADDAIPSVIIMDDRLQNPRLAKDLSIAVVDGKRGIGNGRVIPAGPLRANLSFQMGLADAVIINSGTARSRQSPAAPTKSPALSDQSPALSDQSPALSDQSPALSDQSPAPSNPPSNLDGTQFAAWLRQHYTGPVLDAATQPSGETDWLNGTRVVAFAGIGAPERFFDSLRTLGAVIVASHPFPDHHYFSNDDATRLLQSAKTEHASLVTTEKDLVRLHSGSDALGELKAKTRVLPVKLGFSDQEAKRLEALLVAALQAKRS